MTTTDTATANVPAPRLQRVIRLRDLPDFVGLRRTAIEGMIAEGKFPKPIRLSERSMAWVESDLIAWQQERIAERDGVVTNGREAADDKNPRR